MYHPIIVPVHLGSLLSRHFFGYYLHLSEDTLHLNYMPTGSRKPHWALHGGVVSRLVTGDRKPWPPSQPHTKEARRHWRKTAMLLSPPRTESETTKDSGFALVKRSRKPTTTLSASTQDVSAPALLT